MRSPKRTASSAGGEQAGGEQARWLLLIHQIPPEPAYFRAKVARRLQRIGAVPIKNAVYVLPSNEQTREDFQWVAREIAEEGGDATVCTASLVDGLTDSQVEALFQRARGEDYSSIATEVREGVRRVWTAKKLRDERKRTELEADLARRKKRMGEVIAIDFFDAPGRAAAEASVAGLEEQLRKAIVSSSATGAPETTSRQTNRKTGLLRPSDYRRRTWVTRKNVHIDRIGSAWLIGRFIDPKASFKFVPAGQQQGGYIAKKGEVSFDMFEADFTHVGDRCTFEMLIERFGIREPGLGVLAEMIHDIDVKDAKYGRDETSGVAALIAGIAVAHAEDEERIALGGRMFDALLALYRRRRAGS